MKGVWPWLLVAVLALAGVQTYRLSQAELSAAQAARGFAERIGTLERDARDASERFRTKEKEWRESLDKVAEDAEKEIGKARSAAALADRSAVGLRADYARAVAAYRDLAAVAAVDAGAGQAADQAGDLLADVFRRTDEAAGEIAAFADLANAAGQACWAAAGALNE